MCRLFVWSGDDEHAAFGAVVYCGEGGEQARRVAYFVALPASTALSAREKVSRPNCSTYACPAMSSTMASSLGWCSFICYVAATSPVAVRKSL